MKKEWTAPDITCLDVNETKRQPVGNWIDYSLGEDIEENDPDQKWVS